MILRLRDLVGGRSAASPRRSNSYSSTSTLLLTILVTLCCIVSSVNALAVMSVDLGTEWMKVAVVSPGVPMEIALNPESKRKTAVAVAMRDGERTFGGEAMGVGVRYPKSCYFYLLDLVGKKFDHPSVKLYRERFPFYDMEADPERGTVLFRHDANTTYTPEELLGMVLTHAKNIAEDYTNQKPVRDVVLTVPAYFNQAERRAVFRSAELANLNVLQLINEPMAVALNYGMFRRKEINGTVKHLLFYDMGAYDTTVSIVGYQIMKTKERGFTETHPQAQILGVGYDRTLGGLDLQIRLREYLADKFNELKKPKTDVRKNNRAMAKLFKEAGRVKNVLSANNQIYAQVENVMDDIDFKLEVTRDTFLELNKDYFARVLGPMERAIAASGMTLEEISEFILAGAGTRVPKVQELLNDFIGSGKELGKNLNTDEAAAMGAVYKAADLSTGFKVKKFLTKDAVLFPIEVNFERILEDDDGKPTGQTKVVKKNLYPPMNAFPQKKLMTFNKFTGDFDFSVHYNELDHLMKGEQDSVGSSHLSNFKVKGVVEALEKHKDEANVESKGVKAHFVLDDSGLLNVTGLESVFEKTITVEEQEKAEEERLAKLKAAKNETESDEENKEDTWSKLGESISNFFGEKDGETKEGDGKESKSKDSKDKDKKKDKKDSKKDKEKEKKKEEPPKKKEFKPKVETIKEPLEFESAIADLPDLTTEQLEASRSKLAKLDEHDQIKVARAQALNNLETQVIDTKDKLYQEIYEQSSTVEEREKIFAKCNELSDWIDEEATFDTEVDILEGKLKELTDLTSGLYARVREHTDRPEALGAMDKMINSSEHFLAKAKNSTGVVDGYFTQEELDKLEKKITETKEWRNTALEEQEKQPKYEMPKMTASLIAEKALDMDREVKYLYNKVKIGKAEKDRAAKKAKDAEEKSKKKKGKKKKAGNETETIGEETPTEDSESTTEAPAGEDDATKTEAEEPTLEQNNEEETTTTSENTEDGQDDVKSEDDSNAGDSAQDGDEGGEEATEDTSDEKKEDDLGDVFDKEDSTEKPSTDSEHTEL